MDDADRAQEREQRDRDLALRAVRRLQAEQPAILKGKICCRDCGERIPAKRLRACPDAARCVECQQMYERGW